MSIREIESNWRETGIVCPYCDGRWMTYSDGERPPRCCNCLQIVGSLYSDMVDYPNGEAPDIATALAAQDGKEIKGGVMNPIMQFCLWIENLSDQQFIAICIGLLLAVILLEATLTARQPAGG